MRSPVDDSVIARVRQATEADYDRVVAAAAKAFEAWRDVPAPKRGEIVRQIAEELRRNKGALARLVTLEMGKIEV